MAKNTTTKNEKAEAVAPEVEEATAVETAAPVEPQGAAERLSAITDLDSLEAAYKAMKKELKGTAAAANNAAAIDLVTNAADDLVDDLIAAVNERGMKFTNFTVRYVRKSDTGKGYGEQRGIKTVIGAVRMTVEELEERDEINASEYAGFGEILDDESADTEVIEATGNQLTEWLVDHPSFTEPTVEADEESAE